MIFKKVFISFVIIFFIKSQHSLSQPIETHFKSLYNELRVSQAKLNKKDRSYIEKSEEGTPFTGSTQNEVSTQKWVFISENEIAQRKIASYKRSFYDAFWDVSPKAFLLSLINVIGIQKHTLVMDLLTGNGVDYKNIIAYRILPLRESDILPPVVRGSQQIFPATFRVKIYWAIENKSNHLKDKNFDILKTFDIEKIEKDSSFGIMQGFSGRLLSFDLFFDRPFVFDEFSKTNEGYTHIESSGQILGYGIWSHQKYGEIGEIPTRLLEDSHPDIILQPSALARWASPRVIENTENILPKPKRSLAHTQPSAFENENTHHSLSLVLGISGFSHPEVKDNILRKLKLIFNRENIVHKIELKDIEIHKALNQIKVFIQEIDISNVDVLRKVFKNAHLEVHSIDLKTRFE